MALCTKDVIGHLASFKLSNDEGVGTEMKLLLARAGKHLFKNENPFCDVMKNKCFQSIFFSFGFLFPRKALCPEHLPTPEPNLESAGGQENPLCGSFAQFISCR